ncbi:MAG: hypothetical protein ACD_28C00395G0002 [uncultured bacterium]|nr:MAG: hypothetical protein ACD_28C00395G0002 [uncultured bacterium]KKT74303.1 MAG: hypothetical protein UW70_C0059G0004 [Candidatus Peregrinibacteria bacterium GW2011_GWA2_44_7]
MSRKAPSAEPPEAPRLGFIPDMGVEIILDASPNHDLGGEYKGSVSLPVRFLNSQGIKEILGTIEEIRGTEGISSGQGFEILELGKGLDEGLILVQVELGQKIQFWINLNSLTNKGKPDSDYRIHWREDRREGGRWKGKRRDEILDGENERVVMRRTDRVRQTVLAAVAAQQEEQEDSKGEA